MERHRSLRLVVPCVLLAVCGIAGAARAAKRPTHDQLMALYVVDHNGGSPASSGALAAYAVPFEKILAGCKIGPADLTNLAMALADKSSSVGGRDVTNLEMLKAIARRITWSIDDPHGCGYIYNLAEAHMETGGP